MPCVPHSTLLLSCQSMIHPNMLPCVNPKVEQAMCVFRSSHLPAASCSWATTTQLRKSRAPQCLPLLSSPAPSLSRSVRRLAPHSPRPLPHKRVAVRHPVDSSVHACPVTPSCWPCTPGNQLHTTLPRWYHHTSGTHCTYAGWTSSAMLLQAPALPTARSNTSCWFQPLPCQTLALE